MRRLRSDRVRRLLGRRRCILHIHMLLLLIVVSLICGRVGQSLGFLRSPTPRNSLLYHFPLGCLDGQIMVMILVVTLVEASLVYATLLH